MELNTNCKYIIVKQSNNGRVYTVHIDSDKELAAHITACFELTDESVLSVTRINN
jgi:hypothetical protein